MYVCVCVCTSVLFITTVHYCNGFFLYISVVYTNLFSLLIFLSFRLSFHSFFSSSYFHSSFFPFFSSLAFHLLLAFFCLFPSPIPHLFLSSFIPFSLFLPSLLYLLLSLISILTHPNYFLYSTFLFTLLTVSL